MDRTLILGLGSNHFNCDKKLLRPNAARTNITGTSVPEHKDWQPVKPDFG